MIDSDQRNTNLDLGLIYVQRKVGNHDFLRGSGRGRLGGCSGGDVGSSTGASRRGWRSMAEDLGASSSCTATATGAATDTLGARGSDDLGGVSSVSQLCFVGQKHENKPRQGTCPWSVSLKRKVEDKKRSSEEGERREDGGCVRARGRGDAKARRRVVGFVWLRSLKLKSLTHRGCCSPDKISSSCISKTFHHVSWRSWRWSRRLWWRPRRLWQQQSAANGLNFSGHPVHEPRRGRALSSQHPSLSLRLDTFDSLTRLLCSHLTPCRF
jgi:hypothetical protein